MNPENPETAENRETEVTPVTPTTSSQTVVDDMATPEPHERAEEPYTNNLDADESAADYQIGDIAEREGEQPREA